MNLNIPRKSLFDKIKALASKFKKVDEEYFEELEQILILSDISYPVTEYIISKTKELVKYNNIKEQDKILEIIVEVVKEYYGLENNSLNLNNNIDVILVCGVNGVGKTTSIAKLASLYNKTRKVLLIAADTFRAGAVNQLTLWAEKLNLPIYAGKENADPSSVLYDGLNKAINEQYDLVIVDTAGRVQTSKNLMDELAKLNRIIEKKLNHLASEVLLVLDATTGQNGVIQATSFLNSCNVSGIILTKLDSTSKGGMILSIKEKLNIPVKYVCFGEQVNDIEVFNLDKYVNNIFGGKE